jgi:Ni,Fe-hydrogenase maturation factor
MTKTLVLGVGNPVLADDRVGLYIAERLVRRICLPREGRDLL